MAIKRMMRSLLCLAFSEKRLENKDRIKALILFVDMRVNKQVSVEIVEDGPGRPDQTHKSCDHQIAHEPVPGALQ
jgi:hypothetical protein